MIDSRTENRASCRLIIRKIVLVVASAGLVDPVRSKLQLAYLSGWAALSAGHSRRMGQKTLGNGCEPMGPMVTDS